MIHLDLFSGIGGFSLAADWVWGRENVEHIFCDNDKFCQEVLKKHWPEAQIFGDIRTFTHARIQEQRGLSSGERQTISSVRKSGVYLLTGGFPCQPFSQAGRRKGKADNRFLWPEMLRVIKEFKPTWIIGENVDGLTSMVQFESDLEMDAKKYTQEEMASGCFNVGEMRGRWGRGILDEIVEDLEKVGYEVIPFVIPACALNAPHRRDRVWIIAHRTERGRGERGKDGNGGAEGTGTSEERRGLTHVPTDAQGKRFKRGIERKNTNGRTQPTKGTDSGVRDKVIGHTRDAGSTPLDATEPGLQEKPEPRGRAKDRREPWNSHWLKVATRLCRMDDGLPARVDGLELSKAKHRFERLKTLGNAIVPQVAYEIFKAIKAIDQ